MLPLTVHSPLLVLGFQTSTLMVSLALIGAVFLLWIRRRADDKAHSGADAQDAEADYHDPNYTGILADDDEEEGDPYDRNYGFQTDDSPLKAAAKREEPEDFPDD